jgi:hypothetical protein
MHSLATASSLSGRAARSPATIPYLGKNFPHSRTSICAIARSARTSRAGTTFGPDCVDFTGPNSLTWHDAE